jgi:hypothetical protein
VRERRALSPIVHFHVREVFSRPMLALIGKSIPDMTEAFAKFVEGLKSHVAGA